MSVNWEEIFRAGMNKLDTEDFSQAKEDREQSAQNYYKEGITLKSRGDLTGAIANFTQAIDLDPGNTNAYFKRSASYSYLGKYQNSVDDFTKLIGFNATAANYYNRGVIYYLMGKYRKAIADLTQAIDLEPNFVASYLNVANAYYELNDCQQAYNNYKKAKRINNPLHPQDEHGFFARGIAALNQENVIEGIKYLRQAAFICCEVNNFALNLKINSIIIENN